MGPEIFGASSEMVKSIENDNIINQFDSMMFIII